jgi:branched-subunit amino acid aminotransferase/4-amino-4-deoxychorismate lyase
VMGHCYFQHLNGASGPQHLDALPMACFGAFSLGITLFTTFRSDASVCWKRAHLKRLHTSAVQEGWNTGTFQEFAAHALSLMALAEMECAQHPEIIRVTLVPLNLSPEWFYQVPTSDSAGVPVPLELGMLLHLRGKAPTLRTEQEDFPEASGTLWVVPYTHPAAHVKHGSQWGSLTLRKHVAQPSDEVLWESEDRALTESTHASVFGYHVNHGWVFPPEGNRLPGITLQQVKQVLKQHNQRISIMPIHTHHLHQYRWLVLGNSVSGLRFFTRLRLGPEAYTLSPTLEERERAHQLYQRWYRNSLRPFHCDAQH